MVWYAASLGADAVPLLLTRSPARCAGDVLGGGGLDEQRRRLERDDWRSWNFARARARACCAASDPSAGGRLSEGQV